MFGLKLKCRLCCVLKTCTSTCEQYSECAKCVQSGKDSCNAACRRLQVVDTVRRTIFMHLYSKAPFTLEINFEINLEIYVNLFLSQENF